MKTILRLQIIGAVFSILFGSFLHFLYELSGRLHPVALIAGVNESTWEHLKIGFWPIVIFGIFEYFYYGKNKSNFFLAKAVNLLTVPIVIIILFYGWQAIFPDNLFYDIGIFAFAIALGYYLAGKILKTEKYQNFNLLGAIIIVVMLILYSLFSFFPPHNFLFLDPVYGGYGLIN